MGLLLVLTIITGSIALSFNSFRIEKEANLALFKEKVYAAYGLELSDTDAISLGKRNKQSSFSENRASLIRFPDGSLKAILLDGDSITGNAILLVQNEENKSSLEFVELPRTTR